MGKIGLKTFETIPKGTYPMKVVKVNHKETYNKVEMTLETEAGKQYTERFDLNVDGGAWAFSITARNLLNNNDIDAIDPKELVGKFAMFEVTHETVEYKGRDAVFARARSIAPANGFDDEPEDDDEDDDEEEAPAPAPKKSSKMDLDSILGDD